MFDLTFYCFNTQEVEHHDFSKFIERFGPKTFPSGKALRDLMGTYSFSADGFMEDPRELCVIPKAREFFTAFLHAWPYWLYFCSLEQREFRMMVFCCLPTISARTDETQRRSGTNFKKAEFAALMGQYLPMMNALCERAQCSERDILERSKSLFHHFDLPYFDGEHLCLPSDNRRRD